MVTPTHSETNSETPRETRKDSHLRLGSVSAIQTDSHLDFLRPTVTMTVTLTVILTAMPMHLETAKAIPKDSQTVIQTPMVRATDSHWDFLMAIQMQMARGMVIQMAIHWDFQTHSVKETVTRSDSLKETQTDSRMDSYWQTVTARGTPMGTLTDSR